MVFFRRGLPLAVGFLLVVGINAAPIADCGDGIETELQTTTTISSTVPRSQATLTSSKSTIEVQTTPAASSTTVSFSKEITTSTPSATSASTAVSSSTGEVSSLTTVSGTKYLMVFGDSYSSDGFSASSSIPSSEQPLGVSLPGTTTSGGLNWVGVTATELNTSLTFAFDYAVYGASTDTDLVRGSTPDLVDQVTEFSTYTADASNVAWTAENTVAVFWIGINDVGNSYWDGVPTPIDEIHDKYFAQLQILYDAGVRLFTLFTVPPFDQAPVFASESTAGMSYLRSNITAYNNGLETRLATFQSSNSGVTGTLFNTTDSFTTVLDSPSTYGATDSTCMNSDGTSCVWYDNYHPGQAIHKLVAQGFVETLTGSLF